MHNFIGICAFGGCRGARLGLSRLARSRSSRLRLSRLTRSRSSRLRLSRLTRSRSGRLRLSRLARSRSGLFAIRQAQLSAGRVSGSHARRSSSDLGGFCRCAGLSGVCLLLCNSCGERFTTARSVTFNNGAGEQEDRYLIAALQIFRQVGVLGGRVRQFSGEVTVFICLDVRPNTCAVALNAVELRLFLRGDTTLVQLNGEHGALRTVLSLETFTTQLQGFTGGPVLHCVELSAVGIGLHQLFRSSLHCRLRGSFNGGVDLHHDAGGNRGICVVLALRLGARGAVFTGGLIDGVVGFDSGSAFDATCYSVYATVCSDQNIIRTASCAGGHLRHNGAGACVNNADVAGTVIGHVQQVTGFVGGESEGLVAERNGLLVGTSFQVVDGDTGVSALTVTLGADVDFLQGLVDSDVRGVQSSFSIFLVQLNGLLNLVALGVNHLHGAGTQGGYVELAISGVYVHVHCDVRFALGVGEFNLLDQGVPSGVEDTNAAGARYKDLAAGGVDAYLTRVVDVAFCTAPDNLVGRGIEDRYLVDAGLGHPYVSGCFVVGNTVGRFNLLTGRCGSATCNKVRGRELVDSSKARGGCNVPGADATGQNRRAAGGEGSVEGGGCCRVCQLVLAGQALVLGSAHCNVAAFLSGVLGVPAGNGCGDVCRKGSGNGSERACNNGKCASNGEQLT